MSQPTIVVGVDGSDQAMAALDAAAHLALATSRELLALHVEPVVVVDVGAPAMVAGAFVVAHQQATARSYLDCKLVLAGTGVSWTFETRPGDPATELARVADERDAVCIVVGRRRHSPVGRIFHGSVSDRLVHHCHRPVLVIPAPAH